MTSILTGDIISSRKANPGLWIEGFKQLLGEFGPTPNRWEIFRGDEFQLEIARPEDALAAAIRIKAWLRTLRLDARISIGIGEKNFEGSKISESNGTAFVRSGVLFETLRKQKISLAVNSGDAVWDENLNLMLRLGTTLMQQWLPQSAEFVLTAMAHPDLSQEELGIKLGITQAAVSRRQKRAHFELIAELEHFYRKKIQNLQP